MFDDTLVMSGDTLRESLDAWQTEQEALEAEWNESLAALEAYQSHLDAWQRELAEGREALRVERDGLERDRASAVEEQEASSAPNLVQLAEARDQVAQLSEQLVTRNEEFRILDQERTNLVAELEAARATVKQLAADAEGQKRSLDIERQTLTDRIAQLQNLLEQRTATPVTGHDDEATAGAIEPSSPAASRSTKPASGERPSTHNPVLGSIMEQFGKLRQQRASDRQAGRNAR